MATTARPGITLEDTRKAVAELTAEGRGISADAVRAKLGTGSKTTVLGFLKAIRAESGAPASDGIEPPPEELPGDLLALLGDTASTWYAAAKAKMGAQIDNARQQLASERAELDEVRVESERAQTIATNLEAELAGMRETLVRSEERAAGLAERLTAVQAAHQQAQSAYEQAQAERAQRLAEAVRERHDVQEELRKSREHRSQEIVQLERLNAVLQERLARYEAEGSGAGSRVSVSGGVGTSASGKAKQGSTARKKKSR